METTTVNPISPQTTNPKVVAAPSPAAIASTITADTIHRYPPEVQAEIMNVANQVDPLKLDKIMAFGSIPLSRSFDFALEFMKAVEGTSVDQTVVKEVAELSKQASKKQDELNVAIQEPNFFQRFLMNIFTTLKDKRNEEAKVVAISCYKVLLQLRESCHNWREILRDNYDLISHAIEDVVVNGSLIERYLVAGRIAEKRIAGELEQKRIASEQGGLTEDNELYAASKEGFSAFKTTLLNLEKSRDAYLLHLAQLRIERETNKKLQMAINFQANNSMTTAAQQIMAAILNAQNREIQEGQRSITALNDELLTKVTSGIALTEKEAEQLLLNSVYSIEVGIAAAKTAVQCCKDIEAFDDKQQGHISQEMEKLKVLVQELAPVVGALPEAKPEAQTAIPTASTDLAF